MKMLKTLIITLATMTLTSCADSPLPLFPTRENLTLARSSLFSERNSPAIAIAGGRPLPQPTSVYKTSASKDGPIKIRPDDLAVVSAASAPVVVEPLPVPAPAAVAPAASAPVVVEPSPVPAPAAVAPAASAPVVVEPSPVPAPAAVAPAASAPVVVEPSPVPAPAAVAVAELGSAPAINRLTATGPDAPVADPKFVFRVRRSELLTDTIDRACQTAGCQIVIETTRNWQAAVDDESNSTLEAFLERLGNGFPDAARRPWLILSSNGVVRLKDRQ